MPEQCASLLSSSAPLKVQCQEGLSSSTQFRTIIQITTFFAQKTITIQILINLLLSNKYFDC